MAERWWEARLDERFWLESTDRQDLGADLRAPLTDEAGRDNWRYTLFREARVGDTVFHYDKRRSAIVGFSRIAGIPVEAPIVWAARGSYARERRATPVETPGYRTPLEGYTTFEDPISLQALREARPALDAIVAGLPKGARYFPFELSGRPVRPLQGYAFKLPAAFVSAFAQEALPSASASSVVLGEVSASMSETVRFHALVDEVEAGAMRFEIGLLQRRRARIKGLRRTERKVFGLRAKDWAFHRGGREELQFNLGLDVMGGEVRAFRAGVAFSLETSRSLRDVSVLEPNIARFNDYMRTRPDAFADMAMWYWRGDERSADLPPGPIGVDLVREGTLIFLGQRQPLDSANADTALATLDRLLPMWEWVEGGLATTTATVQHEAPARLETLRLDSGREIDGGRWIQATSRERTIEIYRRHEEMQRRLKIALLDEGCGDVVLEARIGDRAIDAVACYGQDLWFYEIKTHADDRSCIREALGQLLEYAFWPGATKPARIVIVGEPALSVQGSEYLERLRERFPVDLDYRQLTLER